MCLCAGCWRLLSVHVKWSCQCPHESRSSSKRAPCRTIWEWRVWPKILGWFTRLWVADMKFLRYCWRFRNPVNSPVEVGSWNPIIYRVLAPSLLVSRIQPRYVSSSTLASLCQLPGSCVEMPGCKLMKKHRKNIGIFGLRRFQLRMADWERIIYWQLIPLYPKICCAFISLFVNYEAFVTLAKFPLLLKTSPKVENSAIVFTGSPYNKWNSWR